MAEKNQEREIRVFRNKFKEKEKETQPDYKAVFTIDGKKFTAALYIRDSKDNEQYFGGKIYDIKPE